MSGAPDPRERVVIDGDCRKVVITIKVEDCGTTTGPNGGPGTLGPPQPVPTPFLVIPCVPGDPGSRPIPVALALASQAIQAGVANPEAEGGWDDWQIQLSCVVANLGAVGSPAAMIEFYTGAAIGIWNPNHETLTPAEVQADVQLVGRASLTAPPGSTTTVTCPSYWVPGSAEAAQQGVLVQVRDLFTDPMTAPFDAVNDRHVARNDGIMDPSGTTISAVTFTGDTAAPTVIITGHGFGAVPPAGLPNNTTSCGDYAHNGDNYGPADLWFEDVGNFMAGMGTPPTGCCIGIIVQSWSTDQVIYQFGSAYNTFDHWYISPGDQYTVSVRGIRYSGTVSFSS